MSTATTTPVSNVNVPIIPNGESHEPKHKGLPPDKVTSIHAAIIEVRKQARYVKKKTSKGLNYSFAGIEELLRELRTAMDEYGICIYPIKQSVIATDVRDTSTGGKNYVVKVEMTYRLVHALSDTHQEVQVVGEAADTGDKAVNKASTAALKLALRQAFLIETGEMDPDEYDVTVAGSDDVVRTATIRPMLNGLNGAPNEHKLDYWYSEAMKRDLNAKERELLTQTRDDCRERLQRASAK